MLRVVSLLIALALTAAACNADRGDGAASGDGGGATTDIELVGKDTAFDQPTLTAPAGTVRFTFDNQDDAVSHNLHVAGDDVDEKTDIESGPTTQTLEVEVESGTYTYVCDVHPQEMEGELTVE